MQNQLIVHLRQDLDIVLRLTPDSSSGQATRRTVTKGIRNDALSLRHKPVISEDD